ncbi:MAG: hypothetical protein U1F09_09705 [Steroidobacteraceae bacterium]
MNVSLQGARSQARLNWDALEEQRKSTQLLARKIFLVVLAIAAGCMIWQHLSS